MKRDPLCPVNPVYATAPHLPCCVCAALASPSSPPVEAVAWAIVNPKMARPVIDHDEATIRRMATMNGDVVRPLVYGDIPPAPSPATPSAVDVVAGREAVIEAARAVVAYFAQPPAFSPSYFGGTIDALRAALDAHDAAPHNPTPPQGEVEKALRKAVREAVDAGVWADSGCKAVAVPEPIMRRMEDALLAAESAAQEGGAK